MVGGGSHIMQEYAASGTGTIGPVREYVDTGIWLGRPREYADSGMGTIGLSREYADSGMGSVGLGSTPTREWARPREYADSGMGTIGLSREYADSGIGTIGPSREYADSGMWLVRPREYADSGMGKRNGPLSLRSTQNREWARQGGAVGRDSANEWARCAEKQAVVGHIADDKYGRVEGTRIPCRQQCSIRGNWVAEPRRWVQRSISKLLSVIESQSASASGQRRGDGMGSRRDVVEEEERLWSRHSAVTRHCTDHRASDCPEGVEPSRTTALVHRMGLEGIEPPPKTPVSVSFVSLNESQLYREETRSKTHLQSNADLVVESCCERMRGAGGWILVEFSLLTRHRETREIPRPKKPNLAAGVQVNERRGGRNARQTRRQKDELDSVVRPMGPEGVEPSSSAVTVVDLFNDWCSVIDPFLFYLEP
ncbi:hypothetical protein DFH06DRAFT_1129715 [Mycena polygramma]|nr:hypothetical protein DFH06DRAFT_1129715 [Mycena polygramma]